MRAKALLSHIHTTIAPYVPTEEADSIAFWLLEELKDLTRTALVIDAAVDWSETEEDRLRQIAGRLAQQEPLQHILGYGVFYGRNFKVSPAVLIPRPETEELVYWALSLHKKGDRIIDIGTGTGCIPITLAAEGDFGAIYGLDISPEALDMAQDNARSQAVQVNWITLDILNHDLPLQDLDMVISNPPYIRDLEKKDMQANVLDHEPSLALFVPDSDPLLFYRRIANAAWPALKAGGFLLFEINEAFGKEMIELVEGMGYQAIELKKDMQGKDRMLKGQKPLQSTRGLPPAH